MTHTHQQPRFSSDHHQAAHLVAGPTENQHTLQSTRPCNIHGHWWSALFMHKHTRTTHIKITMNARIHSSPKHVHVLAPVPGGSIISMSPNVQKCDLYLCPAASMHTAAEKCVRSAELWCCAFKCLLYFFVLGTNPTNTHFSYSQRSQAATSK